MGGSEGSGRWCIGKLGAGARRSSRASRGRTCMALRPFGCPPAAGFAAAEEGGESRQLAIRRDKRIFGIGTHIPVIVLR